MEGNSNNESSLGIKLSHLNPMIEVQQLEKRRGRLLGFDPRARGLL